MKQRVCTMLMLAALLTLNAAAAPTIVSNISYTRQSDPYAIRRCMLDVYSPEGADGCPVVVWFHGGGLEAGEKFIPDQLKDCGLVVVAVNYRLLPQCSPDDCLADAADAVAWTFDNISKYGGSPDKIVGSGHSAGGYLTMMVGLDRHLLEQRGIDANRIAALVPFSGQCVTHYNVRKLQGIPPLQPTIDKYAPISYLRADASPMVIISGDRELELFGRYEEQAYFWRMLKLVGHSKCLLYEMQGFDHGAMADPAFHVLKQYIKHNIQ